MRAQKARYREEVVVVAHDHLKLEEVFTPKSREQRREARRFSFFVRPPGMLFRDAKGIEQIHIQPGYICSTDGTSHYRADNVDSTVVSTYEAHNPLADDADDAHEKSFKVKDPCLMTRAEAESCRNTPHCVAWFRGVFPAKTAERIAKALRRTSFDRPAYQVREMEMYAELAR